MLNIDLKCTLLSPVHIGSGDQISPMDYVIANERLHRLRLDLFLADADESLREKFETLVDQGDIIRLRTFVAENISPERHAEYSVRVTPAVEAMYVQKRNNLENQLLITPFIISSGRALIPGSSLKGAIRTAVVSETAIEKRLRAPKGSQAERQFEENVFGYHNAREDPFRCLKLRDGWLEKDTTMVRQVFNTSAKAQEGARGIEMIYEMTEAACTDATVQFNTRMQIDKGLIARGRFRERLSFPRIQNACNRFYRDKLEREHAKFYRGTEAERYSEMLLDTAVGPDAFLLRLGRFSGVESVTLDTYRNPRPPRHMKVWGTTRNLADGMIPMGWILCRAMNGVPHGQQGTGTGSGKKTASGKGKRSKPPMGPAGKKAGPPDLSALQKRFRVTKGNRKKSGK